MKKHIIVAGLLLASSAAFAQAQMTSKLYAELGYHNTEFKDNSLPGFSPKLDVITGILGYKFHPNLSGEVLLGTGLSTKNTVFGGVNVGTKVDHSYGLILRPSVMFSDKFEGFARLGYGRTKVSVSVPGATGTGSGNSPIWGLGANYYFTNTVYGQLSYTSFYDKDGTTGRGFGASVGYKF